MLWLKLIVNQKTILKTSSIFLPYCTTSLVIRKLYILFSTTSIILRYYLYSISKRKLYNQYLLLLPVCYYNFQMDNIKNDILKFNNWTPHNRFYVEFYLLKIFLNWSIFFPLMVELLFRNCPIRSLMVFSPIL